MKKSLSIIMAMCIVLTSSFTGIYAIAAETDNQTQELSVTKKVASQLLGAANYITAEDASFTAENAGDFYNLIKSGKDVSSFKDAFVESVKENLDTNKGKIIVTKTDYDENWKPIVSNVESAAAYGAVILSLDALGIDYKGFKGYNIASSFAEIDVKNVQDNPYLYNFAIAGALKADNKVLAKALADKLVADYYTTDKGMNYYGFSCDNTGAFVVALSLLKDDYKAVIDNALSIIAKYKTAKGYIHMLPGTETPEANLEGDANCDSTAYALAAYASVGDTEKAAEAYKLLCTFESKTGDGIFTYDSEDNYYATKDALFALIQLNSIVTDCLFGHTYEQVIVAPTCTEDGYTLHTCKVCKDSFKDNEVKAVGHKYEKTVKEPTCTEAGITTYTCTVCKDTYQNDKVDAKGHSFGNNNANCSVCNAVNPSFKLAKVTGLKTKSRNTKSIRIQWDKVDAADCYIVYKYNNESGKYDYVAQVDASKNNYLASGIKAGEIVKFRVAAVKGNVIGEKSSYLKTSTTPKQGNIKSVKSKSKKKITVSYSSRACTGYEIQWSTTKDFSSNYKSVRVGSSTTTKTITTAQSRKAYFVRVRSYVKAGGVTSYGKWSPARLVTTK